MRKILIVSLSFLFFLVLGCGEQFPKKFSFLPEKPQADQKIKIKYNPEGTHLEKAKEVEALAYQYYGAKMPVATEVELKKKGKGWVGSFMADDSTLLILINFIAGKESDNNEKAGYQIVIYDADGNYLPGGQGTVGYAYYTGAYPVGIKRDVNLAREYLEKEFEQHPEQKSNFKSIYWNVLLRSDKKNGKTNIKIELDKIAAKKYLSLDDEKTLANWYSRVDENQKAEQYKNEVVKAEPKGDFAQMDQFRRFRTVQGLNEKVKFFELYKNDFPDSRYISYMASTVLRGYTKAKQYDGAEAFLKKEISKPDANLYNTIAWDMVENETNLKTAVKLAGISVELARKELENPSSEKPSYLTEKEWKDRNKYPLSNALDTQGFALYKLGETEKAVPLLKEALEITEKNDNEVNKHFAEALVAADKNKKVYEFTKELLKEGKKFAGIGDIFKKAYVSVKGSEDGLEETLVKIQGDGINKLKAELEKEMLDKPAPDFSLEDLDGNTVSLTGLKGKIVILDFWATWCGPCIRAFPAMQKAMYKFKDNENVKFIFINTWERGEGVKEKVAKFIKEKNVSFHVLFDLKNEVVTAYGVEGIPTKFLVDKNGKIRFKSVGFSGDDEKLVEELSLMVEMVK